MAAAPEWAACSPHPGPNARQVRLGRGQQPIAADHETLAQLIQTGDLRHIAVIEQRELQRSAIGGQCLASPSE